MMSLDDLFKMTPKGIIDAILTGDEEWSFWLLCGFLAAADPNPEHKTVHNKIRRASYDEVPSKEAVIELLKDLRKDMEST